MPIDAVRAISVSPLELRIKRKQHWKQASAEMKEYIRQCECVNEILLTLCLLFFDYRLSKTNFLLGRGE